MTHINNLGQACEGRFCLDCGKCDQCSTKAKRPVAIVGKSHTPHVYERPTTTKPARAKRTKSGATV